MQNENFVEKISSNFTQSVAIKNVFGEPVQTGEKTIIPVASIAYGFGGGFGQGNKRGAAPDPESEGSGGGAGGGLRASAKGIYEVTPAGTRFIPASPSKYVVAGVVAGFLLKALFFSKKG